MAAPSRFIRQAAAIPIKDGQVCLVTSSSGRRWVIPKGMIESGLTPAETALQEAWEEAGVLGLLTRAVGTYRYEKYGGTCLVTVYPMQVHEVRDDWPEADIRRRIWLAPDDAIDWVEEEGLRDLLRQAFLNEAYSESFGEW